jgi:hypothetical protein
MGDHRRKQTADASPARSSSGKVPASQSRKAHAKIREFERALGRKTIDVEILRMVQEIMIAAAVE